MRLARRYLVSGRVQGVGFRVFAWSAATHEGLSGWVKNLPDGRVEIAAEGEMESLERFERQVRMGPRGSRVDQVDASDAAVIGADIGFEIR